jgi:hypothetical protein
MTNLKLKLSCLKPMEPAKKSLIAGINRIYLGVFFFLQGFWFLAGYSDAIYSNYAANFFFYLAIVVALPGFLIFLGVRQYRRYRLHFKTDKKTKRMTYAELATSITGFSLFGISAYAMSIFDSSNPDLLRDFNQRHIPHPYQGISFILFILAFLIIFAALVMNYYFLPKQITDEPKTESSAAAP